MLFIDKNGMVDAERIVNKRFMTIERGELNKVNGIVVHQTDSTTATSTFNSYQNSGAAGAHFLIDKNGVIYQTASVYKVTWHVGKSQSRCFLKHKCEAAEFEKIFKMEKTTVGKDIVSKMEQKKISRSFPY